MEIFPPMDFSFYLIFRLKFAKLMASFSSSFGLWKNVRKLKPAKQKSPTVNCFWSVNFDLQFLTTFKIKISQIFDWHYLVIFVLTIANSWFL